MTAPYVLDGARLVAERPDWGPCWDGKKVCSVGLDHRRRRKTGPAWGWVAVMRCIAHRRAFTAYPPGHVPYGQVPVVALAPDGGPEIRAEDEAAVETLFTAALDAARKDPRLWPRSEADGATRTTQIRRLERGAAALCLLADAGPGATVAAAVSHLPCGALVEAKAALSAAHGLLARAPVVAATFRDLVRRAGRAVMDRLAVLGHLAGLWGAPYRWDPRRGRLVALGEAFWRRPATGTRGPSTSSSRRRSTHDSGSRDPP